MMKNSLFANGFIVLIGVLMLVAALQLFGWGQGTKTLEPELFDASVLSQLDEMADNSSQTDEDIVKVITAAPLFNLDRKPYVGELEVDDGADDPPIEEPEPLKAKVTSIMITGEDRFAILLDQLSKEKVTLKQGMPLPGEQGQWVVEQIDARMVTFVSEGNEPVKLELEVYDGALAGKGSNNGNNRNNRNNQRNKDEGQKEQITQAAAKKNSAEEIRKKIAERRAQMRANAAKGQKQ